MLFILWKTRSHSVFLVLPKCQLPPQHGLSLFRDILCLLQASSMVVNLLPAGPLSHHSAACRSLSSPLAVMPNRAVRCFPAEGCDFEDSLNHITSRNTVTETYYNEFRPTPQSPQDCPYLDTGYKSGDPQGLTSDQSVADSGVTQGLLQIW